MKTIKHLIVVLALIHESWAIRCHQCISRNGDNRNCEMPQQYMANECYPATTSYRSEPSRYCISLRSTSYNRPGEQVLLRTCTSTPPPNCGTVQYGNENFNGCPQVCTTDGCNYTDPPQQPLYANDNQRQQPNNMQYQPYNQYNNNRFQPGMPPGMNTGPSQPMIERTDTRSGPRSIVSFGRMLVSLLLMRTSKNKQ